MGDVLLKVEGLSFAHDGRPALRDISFSLRAGEVLGVIGPNGGGKSTLLRVLAGLADGFAGEVVLGGRARVGRMRPAPGETAYVPQFGPPPEGSMPLLCGEYVALGALHRGTAEPPRADDALRAFGIQGRRSALMGELSGGERRRAALARAELSAPGLFLLDEPAAGLDGDGLDRLLALMGRTKEAGRAMIVADHNIGGLLRHCDRILCLDRNVHWHDKRDALTKEVLDSFYRCELERGLLHERRDLDPAGLRGRRERGRPRGGLPGRGD